jgi:hypothetical protein
MLNCEVLSHAFIKYVLFDYHLFWAICHIHYLDRTEKIRKNIKDIIISKLLNFSEFASYPKNIISSIIMKNI